MCKHSESLSSTWCRNRRSSDFKCALRIYGFQAWKRSGRSRFRRSKLVALSSISTLIGSRGSVERRGLRCSLVLHDSQSEAGAQGPSLGTQPSSFGHLCLGVVNPGTQSLDPCFFLRQRQLYRFSCTFLPFQWLPSDKMLKLGDQSFCSAFFGCRGPRPSTFSRRASGIRIRFFLHEHDQGSKAVLDLLELIKRRECFVLCLIKLGPDLLHFPAQFRNLISESRAFCRLRLLLNTATFKH